MPIYEFVCLECGSEFEQLLAFSATKTPACPKCHSERVQRRLSAPAIHFKGSGWYVTDSKNSAKGSANGKTQEVADKSDAASDGEKATPEKNGVEKSSSEKGEATKSSENASTPVKEKA